MDSIRVQTTQNVEINYEVASLSDRIFAVLIDYVVILAYFILLSVMMYLAALKLGDVSIAVFVLIFLPTMFYDLLFETFMNGQSIGKKLMNIKVIKVDGTQPSFLSYFIRWILRLVDIVLFSPAVGVVTILINGKGQRLGDIAANTTVVKLVQRAKLSDTLFEEVEAQHAITYHEVAKLNDSDVETIKEVLKTTKTLNRESALKLQERAKLALEQKMGIKATQPSIDFLETLVKDYNAYRGRLE